MELRIQILPVIPIQFCVRSIHLQAMLSVPLLQTILPVPKYVQPTKLDAYPLLSIYLAENAQAVVRLHLSMEEPTPAELFLASLSERFRRLPCPQLRQQRLQYPALHLAALKMVPRIPILQAIPTQFCAQCIHSQATRLVYQPQIIPLVHRLAQLKGLVVPLLHSICRTICVPVAAHLILWHRELSTAVTFLAHLSSHYHQQCL